MLSLHTQGSTSPAADEPDDEATSPGGFRKIGAGACGLIFAQDGLPLVYKLAKVDNDELWNDYTMHQAIAREFYRFIIDEVRVPECYSFIPRGSFDNNPKLVDVAKDLCNLPTCALITERIPPLPSQTRHQLIEKYCSPRIKTQAHADPANQDCLVRVYLGSMQGKIRGLFFSLRNFKLHLNHMVELELDVKTLARRMGIALAVLHWAAKTDARDVEFVLGNSTNKDNTAELFVLDFNQARAMTMDDDGVALAVDAWGRNDPYYPRPLGNTDVERLTWRTFVVAYLAASREILGQQEQGNNTLLDLPRKFILGVTAVERTRMESRAA